MFFVPRIISKTMTSVCSWLSKAKPAVKQNSGKANNARRVLLVELLEAPWWVIEAHIADYPDSPLAQLVKSSVQSSVTTTQAEDDLRYWVSSASLMRGVPVERHGLKFLNQRDSMAFPPLWILAAAHGCRVGVWGTSFSHDWRNFKSESIDFYLPDKFGADNFAYPARTVAYQRILRLLSRLSDMGYDWSLQRWRVRFALSRFVISRAIRMQLGAVKALFRGDGLSLRFKPRALIGARLAFYEFMSIYPRHTPDFATLTIGSLATALHLGAKSYTEAESLPHDTRLANRSNTLVGKALQELDLVIADLLQLAREKNLTLLVVSGYGQRPDASAASMPIVRDMWVLSDLSRLLDHLEVNVRVKRLPSMFPCSTLMFENNTDRDVVVNALSKIYQPGGKRHLFHVELGDGCMSVRLDPNKWALKMGLAWVRAPTGAWLRQPMQALGIKQVRRNTLTGEHNHGGIFMIHRSETQATSYWQEPVPEDAVARFVLDLLDITPPDYMSALPKWLDALYRTSCVC